MLIKNLFCRHASKNATLVLNVKTFKDVKGCDDAKQELEKVVEYLKNPSKFIINGANDKKSEEEEVKDKENEEGSKEEVTAKLLEFLESPRATTDVLLADKEQKGKKRKATPSKNIGSADASETSAKMTYG
ncbi:hypothetical protein GOBAR_AA10435 [Gossypium barbadense]|uniref:Uncharacterized protein n=1 Tax=Gossypium barbadense TaxID=3634 RepID=A0A2P5Y3L4_GOSBA|nr:hypothetical protein GOBAR_AA10435 [Gossypium barbadense]